MDTLRSLTHRRLRTAIASLVAGALALPGASVFAAAPPSASPIEERVTDEAGPTTAQSLFEQGLDAYESDDFAGAAELWSEAHALMAQEPELSAGRRVLGFDLAQAQMRAYDSDHDESRVVAAKPLLQTFVAWVDRPGHTMDEGEKQDRMRAIELLERIESESSPPQPVPAPAVAPPAPVPTHAPPPPVAPQPNGTGLLVGGGIAIGGSVASVVAASAAVGSGRKAQRRFEAAQQEYSAGSTTAEAEIEAADRAGRRANIGFLVAATSAVLLVAGGVTMLAIGARRRKRHVSASASLSPSSAAAAVSVRF